MKHAFAALLLLGAIVAIPAIAYACQVILVCDSTGCRNVMVCN